ncbi:MAG: hypothetical protein R3F36_09765 [Candidatus Competibacteraceae bacterium]
MLAAGDRSFEHLWRGFADDPGADDALPIDDEGHRFRPQLR